MKREYGAQSEYKRLVKVLMHIPGEEIELVNGENRDEYLFRDVPDLERIREEHLKFVEILRGEGVEVILIEELLKNTELIDIIKLCPNMMFTRDTGTITNIGAIIGRMAKPCRRPEPYIVMEALKRLNIPVALKIEAPATFEGGDAVWLDERTLMIGYETRTSEDAVDKIAKLLIEKNCTEKVIGVPLPKYKVHLDGTIMILSENLAVARVEALRTYPSKIYNGNEVKPINLIEWLRRRGYEIIPVTSREDRLFGANLVGIGGGKVISYSWNKRIMKELEKRGFDVIGVDGHEIIKAGGGLHCMILPLLREQ